MEDGRIKTDLPKKETDGNMYLLPSSCHPIQTTKAIPFSLDLKIVRMCSNPEDRDNRLVELVHCLLARENPRNPVKVALEKAKKVPSNRALIEFNSFKTYNNKKVTKSAKKKVKKKCF